ncbi:MAG TPA: ATP-binding protein [Trichocoleus sp.]|jgi:PAS domain S-box-containing protein
MQDLIRNLIFSGPFIPHGHCYLWKPGLVWLHVSSDALIALAYYSIPLTLFYFVRKRKDLPFHGIFLLFAAFIVGCGTTHLAEIWTLWYPTYWLSGLLKAGTAFVSMFTALELIPLVPQALALPSPAQLEQANEELKQSRNQLEQRVQERTADLAKANAQLQQEIQERRHTAEILREREERFRQLAENIHEVFWIADPQQAQMLYISPAYETIWGRSCQSLYEHPETWLSTVHPDDRKRLKRAVGRIRSGEHQLNEEYRIIRPDGEFRWIWARTSPVQNEAGQVYRIVGIAEDITDRKRVDQEREDLLKREQAAMLEIANLNRDLQDRVNELQTLFEVIPIGILMTNDPEFKHIQSNPSFSKILGVSDHNASCTPPEANPRPTYKIFRDGRELSPNETPIRYAAIHGVNVEGVEVDILRGDGVLFNLYGFASPLFDEQQKPRGAVGAFLDITDRKQAEAEREQLLERERIAREQAEAANQIKDEFLAVLSHELRTPLNPILGWTRLLRTGNLNQEKTELALETIDRNAKLQTQLIEDLLDISRILQGKLTLNASPVDLTVAIEAAKETIRLAAEAKSIQIQTELQSTPRQVMGDPNRLQQVIWNLLSNAVKFTPAGGQVKVTLQYVGTQAQIQVIDTGKGITPDFLPYVFDTFRQADGTTTRKFGGLGLGLAIVRRIVELHGGIVQAESQGEDRGAAFTVWLPLITETLQINLENRQLSSSLDLEGVQVLVVDDEADTRTLVAFMLEQRGAKVIAVSSAAEGLQQIQQAKPDVILSDIGMPNVDGYSFIQQVRSLKAEQGGTIPAIALTAYAAEFDQKQAFDAGFQMHIAKPMEMDVLMSAIKQLVVRHPVHPS